MDKRDQRNRFFFGIGTIGRDAFYTMVSMFLMTYITEVLEVSNKELAMMTFALVLLRIFDAFNDPFMGIIIDNTRTKFGKFKPSLVIGGLLGAFFMLMMFKDNGLDGISYVLVFSFCYLMWDITYGLNDIAYWSMLPSLSTDQKTREEIGSFARICANIGMFAVVVGIIPATSYLETITHDAKQAWFIFAIIVACLMLGFQLFTLFGVKEKPDTFKEEEKTSIKEMFQVIFKNDQLMWIAISFTLFMIGYGTTTSFGVHYFKYIFGNEDMYSIFALILGISQLSALLLFNKVREKFTREKLYGLSIILITIGYILFFFAPMNMIPIGIAGILIFVGQAFIQMLMLMFLSDCIEYGQWKLGKRNESITFSIQPFIYKVSGAIASGVLGVTLILSGINEASSAQDVTMGGTTLFKISMMIIPIIVIVVGFIIYKKKFIIDERKYDEILKDLEDRGDINNAN